MKRTFRVYWKLDYKKSFFSLRSVTAEIKSKELSDFIIKVLEKRKVGYDYDYQVSRVESITTCQILERFEA